MINGNRIETKPSALGFAMPAEWERHQGTWLSWPHNTDTWPEELDAVERALSRFVQLLAPFETVHINVNDEDHLQDVSTLLSDAAAIENVRFHLIPTNDAWVRDHGAIIVCRKRGEVTELAATRWFFNSWGEKYPPWNRDNEVPVRMAETLGIPLFQSGIILEGGSIEVNGCGLLLTTERCLLNPNRNPHLSREEIESYLVDYFGVQEILWLHDGIIGDDTDGHIDDIARFVNPSMVVAAVENDPLDANYPILQDNLHRLRSMKTVNGNTLDVIELPMPSPVFIRGERMPASYANFYIGNGIVIVPTFDDPMDSVALEIIGRAFPGRKVAGVGCREVIWGLGALHCLTQQVPAGIPAML